METGPVQAGALKEQSPLGFLEAPVVGIISKIPSRRLKAFGQAFFRPVDTFNEQKSEASLRNYTINFALAGLVGWVGILFGMAFVFMLMAPSLSFFSASIQTQLFGDFIAVVLFTLVLLPLAVILSGIIMSAVYFIIAKLLGGSGSFTSQTFAFSLIIGASSLVLLPFHMLAAIPFVGLLMLPISIFLALYIYYLYYKAIRSIHGLSQGKAIAVLVIPMAIAVLLIIALVAIALAGFFPGLAAGTTFPSSDYDANTNSSLPYRVDAKIGASQSYWGGEARPFAILEHSVSVSGDGIFTLQDLDASGMLTVTSFKVGGAENKERISFVPGETKTIRVSGLPSGSRGKQYDLDVTITYSTLNLDGMKQYGAKNLVGEYS